MSVQQLSARHLSYIVIGLMQLNTTKAANMLAFNTFTRLENYCSLEANNDPANLFNKLAELNAAAYNSRYEDGHALPIECNPLLLDTDYNKGPFRGELNGLRVFTPIPGFYRTVKLIDSYLYQCCEPATLNEELYKLLESISTDLKVYVFEHTESYCRAPWTAASWEQ